MMMIEILIHIIFSNINQIKHHRQVLILPHEN